MNNKPHLQATGRTKREALVGLIALRYLSDPVDERQRLLAFVSKEFPNANPEATVDALLREAGIKA